MSKDHTMTSTWNKVLIFCIPFLLLSGCGGSDDKQGQTTNTAIKAPSDAIFLSTDSVGKITASTPFNIHHITEAFSGLNVSQQTSFQEGEAYPVIRVAKGAKTLLTINPTTDQKSIYSIVIEDNLIHNHLGHRLSTKFSSIYSYDHVEKCLAGQEELSGKTICYAPKMRNILYIFAGRWDGPDGEIPPEDILATWTLDSIIWKPQS